ncbi:MAG: hydrogenase formation protein HypD [Deltaproteobacteria bacterium]|nr:hydrogenase formation protein HypD [Deltaproteobacteria bacterium]
MTGAGPARVRVEAAVRRIREAVARPLRIMEVCGTHTMAIGRHGLRSLFPPDLRLLSGPGCPVCVTPGSDIDQAIDLARRPGTVVTTFGDMLRVPGARRETLDAARAAGAHVRIVYSALDAVELARNEPATEVVFIGVGFETTSPTIAAAMKSAREGGVANFSVLPSFKLVPPAMTALCAAPDVRIEGFLCPGHVSAIIGVRAYAPVAEAAKVPCVIAGFDPVDILEGVAGIVEQVRDGRHEVVNGYPRAVHEDGNPAALALLEEIFEVGDAAWRGIGVIPRTGLNVREGWAALDARRKFGLPAPEPDDLPEGCSCGLVMRGVIVPPECPLFRGACTPAAPVGPCMVSSEGACAAYHKYGG